MNSQEEYSSYFNGYPPYRPGSHSGSAESSPPKSASISSSSESRGKQSSSSFSDDEMLTLSNLSITHVEEKVYSRYRVDCPPFVPRGILASMPDEAPVDNHVKMSSGLLTYQGPSYFQHKTESNLGSSNDEGPAEQKVPAWRPTEESPPAPELQKVSGEKRFGQESCHPTEAAPRNFFVRSQGENKKFFEFPKENASAFPFPPVAGEPLTRIHVYTDRKVHFAGGIVPFIIQVLNPPQDFQVHPRMFHASVRSPTGNLISCRVRNSDSYIINSFVGTFRADEETGKYAVRVALRIPFDKLAKYKHLPEFIDGAVHGFAYFAISKNYGMDCQNDCLRIQCEFQKVHRDRVDDPGRHGIETDLQQTFRIRSKLWGLTCDTRNNNLLYADRESHQVICVSPRGDTVFKFGRNSSIPQSHQLCRPCGVVFDEKRNRLVVSDKDNHRICFFSLDGQFLSSFGYRGHHNGAFEYPWDVDVSPNGTIVVADSKNKRVQLFDPLGNYLCKYTVFEVSPFEYKTQLDYPRGVCFDNTGSHIYVSDFNVNNIIKIACDLSGHQKILPRGTLLRPQGITMDSTGNLLVADSRHDCVRHMNIKGEHLSTVREIVKERLVFPVNVTTMAGGFIAVLTGNGKLVIY